MKKKHTTYSLYIYNTEEKNKKKTCILQKLYINNNIYILFL